MITYLNTCAVNHELDLHNIVVTLEPTQQVVNLTLLCAVGFWLEPDIHRYFCTDKFNHDAFMLWTFNLLVFNVYFVLLILIFDG